MSLPGITAPSGTPVFLAEGHNVQERGRHESVQFQTGHSRTRTVRSALERIVAVEWFLEEDVAAAVYEWGENTLQAWSREWAAQVVSQDGPGLLWWTAKWLEMPTWEALHFGRKRLSGRLFMTGEGSPDAPNTSSMAVEFSDGLQAGVLRIPAGARMAIEFSDGLIRIDSLRIEFSDGLVVRVSGDQRRTEAGTIRNVEGGQIRETEQEQES
jgi:hypothetical protein